LLCFFTGAILRTGFFQIFIDILLKSLSPYINVIKYGGDKLMKLKEILSLTESIVNDLSNKLNKTIIDHKTLEEEILKHINKIGHFMEQEILENVKEPTNENRIIVDNEEAVFNR